MMTRGMEAFVACRGLAAECIRLRFWWLSDQVVGSNPGHNTCFQLSKTLDGIFFSRGKWVNG